jgi:hypothetical protein
VTTITALIELLVGAACAALAWPAWRRRDVGARVVAACLFIAGAIAIANAIGVLVH